MSSDSPTAFVGCHKLRVFTGHLCRAAGSGRTTRSPLAEQSLKAVVTLFAVIACVALQPTSAAAQVDVLTYHNDTSRTGQNLNETALTPATVNSNTFGKLFSYDVDGAVYAQPLYVSNLVIPGRGTHNVVFVATEHDSVYAFDADDSSVGLLWRTSFVDPVNGVTTVPSAEVSTSDIVPKLASQALPLSTGIPARYMWLPKRRRRTKARPTMSCGCTPWTLQAAPRS